MNNEIMTEIWKGDAGHALSFGGRQVFAGAESIWMLSEDNCWEGKVQ